MILLIDGYNLIKNVISKDANEKVREDFVKKLNIYAKKRHHKITIVFDGGGYTFPTTDIFQEVTITYSGYKYSADEIIKNILDDHKNKELLLITSDNELRKFAKQINIDSISSQEFYNFMKEEKEFIPELSMQKSDDIAHKITQKTNDELDKLMQEASKTILKKKEDFEPKSKAKLKELPKNDRKLIKKIKKL